MARSTARTLWARKLAGRAVPAAVPEPAARGLRQQFRGCILGIDPSLRGTGLAVVLFTDQRTLRLLESCTVKAPPGATLPQCLGVIGRAVDAMIVRHTLDAVAVEETIFVQNFRTAQILGAARGAAIAAAAMRALPVSEYPPLRVKQAVVGFGRASKEQVAKQIQDLLNLPLALPFDESDAAAVAICHGYTGAGL
jgi:crossover junction endodeoxyribonuclease RuvC